MDDDDDDDVGNRHVSADRHTAALRKETLRVTLSLLPLLEPPTAAACAAVGRLVGDVQRREGLHGQHLELRRRAIERLRLFIHGRFADTSLRVYGSCFTGALLLALSLVSFSSFCSRYFQIFPFGPLNLLFFSSSVCRYFFLFLRLPLQWCTIFSIFFHLLFSSSFFFRYFFLYLRSLLQWCTVFPLILPFSSSFFCRSIFLFLQPCSS